MPLFCKAINSNCATGRRCNGIFRLGAHLLACFALSLASPAMGQVYKWVDEDGLVTYSSTPPDNRKLKFKLFANKVSTVRQEKQKADPPAPVVADNSDEHELAGKIDELERKIAEERKARQVAEAQAAAQAAYAQQLAQQPDTRTIGYIPTVPSILFVRPEHRRHSSTDLNLRGKGFADQPRPQWAKDTGARFNR